MNQLQNSYSQRYLFKGKENDDEVTLLHCYGNAELCQSSCWQGEIVFMLTNFVSLSSHKSCLSHATAANIC